MRGPDQVSLDRIPAGGYNNSGTVDTFRLVGDWSQISMLVLVSAANGCAPNAMHACASGKKKKKKRLTVCSRGVLWACA